MSITIKKIVALCNTSRGTVDRVINNRGNVNAELKKKILSVMEEYEYEPNVTAKALSNSRKKQTIGVVINSLENSFYDEVSKGINDAASEVSSYGVKIEIRQIKGYSAIEQHKEICKLEKLGINGLIITPIQDSLIVDKIQDLKEKGIPTALINADLEKCDRLVLVSTNNERSGRVAADMVTIASNQNGRIAIVTGSFNNLGHSKRVEGFVDVIQNSEKSLEIVSILENDDDNEKSYTLVKNLLEKEDLDIIYFSAAGVRGGIRAIEESQKPVKAVTMDESDVVKEYVAKGIILATVTQQPYEQGYKPIKIMANYLVLGTKPLKTKVHTINKIKVKNSNW